MILLDKNLSTKENFQRLAQSINAKIFLHTNTHTLFRGNSNGL